MSKRTLFLIFALVVITAVLVLVAIYNPNARPAVTEVTPAPQEEVAQTVLSFGDPVIATSSSASVFNYSVPVNISTGKNRVTAVQLELQYDPKILSNVSVAAGPFFPKPEVLLNQIDPETGRVSYAFGVGLTDQGITGQNTAATLNFSVQKPIEPTAIIFLPKTLVTAEDAAQSVLKQTNNIQLTAETLSSSPTASPLQ